jgi:hypothetical protein
MARSNKTSNLLKLLNLVGRDASGTPPEAIVNGTPEEPKINGTPRAAFPTSEPEEEAVPDVPRKKPRKNITKHMKPFVPDAPENPALKAINAEIPEAEPKVFTRSVTERQIVSVPLLLITEQLGTAVERFNACACDECLHGIINSALELMPPMYVRVVSDADENEVNRLIREGRPEVIRVLAKICIKANTKPFHEG